MSITTTEHSPGDDAVMGSDADRLGSRIRAARKKQRLSIRELSTRVGVSASFVSQVELGRATPSIGVLYSIASVLELSLDSLMNPGNAETPASVPSPGPASVAAPIIETPVSSGGLPNFQSGDDRSRINVGSVLWERLTNTDVENIEFLQVTYPPGSESCPVNDLQRHSGWEFGHVISGSMSVQVGFSSGILNAGDSIHFSSTVPHRLSNSGDDTCVAIWVVVGRTHSKTGAADLFS